MASSIFIGWFGGQKYVSDGSTTTFTGNIAVTGQFYGPAADNTAAPPFSFTGDTDTGMGSAAADTLNFVTGGTSRVSISTTTFTSGVPILGPAGTAAAPAFAGTGVNSNTGGYFTDDDKFGFTANGTYVFDFNSGRQVALGSDVLLGWRSGTNPNADAVDVSLSRGAENRLTLAVGDTLNLAPTAFASLPAGAEGNLACVTDSNTATWGATIAGGGANNVLAFHNGANWVVMGA